MTEDSRKHEHRLSRENPGEAADLAERNRLLLGAVHESDAAEGYELSFDSKKDIAGCFLRLADMPTGALDRLSRYEHMLWRQPRQIVFALDLLRPQATAEPLSLSIFIPAARARRLVRRVQVITREVNAERADPRSGQLASSLQIAGPNQQSPPIGAKLLHRLLSRNCFLFEFEF